MKKVFYSVAILVCVLIVASCNKDDDYSMDNVEPNIATRADTLGFSDVEAYEESVAEQHAAGNHVNCDTLADGTHQPCSFVDHSGENHDGTGHNGIGHGTHDAGGHSHDGKEKHNGKH